mmetsp:Transcript_37837/g.112987  ORF Transcript_37837/g.112987 Transcript_37837/m.112987 type:complete len:263 (-) Transcript_37837:125-913(-)
MARNSSLRRGVELRMLQISSCLVISWTLATGASPSSDTCPTPYPPLDELADSTITSPEFSESWPANLAGTWYVVAVADRFQMPAQFRCTRYNYSVASVAAVMGSSGERVTPHARTDATYVSLNISSGVWTQLRSAGYAGGAPGMYHEWPTSMVPPGADPHSSPLAWYDPIVHFGADVGRGDHGSRSVLCVKWGCTRAPLGSVQYIEVLSRQAVVPWTDVRRAVGKLLQRKLPNVANLRPVDHTSCHYPWTPARPHSLRPVFM